MNIFLKDPGAGALMTTLTVVTTGAVLARFLFDGVTFTLSGVGIAISHADAMTYAAILSPVYAAHGWITNKPNKNEGEKL